LTLETKRGVVLNNGELAPFGGQARRWRLDFDTIEFRGATD